MRCLAFTLAAALCLVTAGHPQNEPGGIAGAELTAPKRGASSASREEQERLLRRVSRLERLLNPNVSPGILADRERERLLLEELRRLERQAELSGDADMLAHLRELRIAYFARRNHAARGDDLPTFGNDFRGRLDGVRLVTIRFGLSESPPLPALSEETPPSVER